jgi:Ca-activated chloride channel family protein
VTPLWRAAAEPGQKSKLPRPRQLDSGITWQRDPVTGELHAVPAAAGSSPNNSSPNPERPAIRVTTQMVPVTCWVFGADGAGLSGLTREDFRLFDEGVEQKISYFDASTEPASVALVIDASPSVFRESGEMKQAAKALVENLAPSDEVAVVDFSAHAYLLLSFSRDRDLLDRAIGRVDVRGLFSDAGGTNIYEAVHLSARQMFEGRTGRKAIVLLTDGQDSGLGLTLDPSSASLRPGEPPDRLTFDDVTRALAAEDIQVFAVSTQNRPKVMTQEWLAAHRTQTLVNSQARELGIPAYTLYLAELVRRSGGQLYFLREAETLADTYRRIAASIRTEYTLGYYPSVDARGMRKQGWRSLRVEVVGHGGMRVVHRAAYYVPGGL